MDKRPYTPVDWKKYFLNKNPIIEKYIATYGLKIINQIFLKIKSAQKRKLPNIPLIKFSDTDDIAVVLHQHEYEYALKSLLEFCIRIEYYEMCSEIHAHLNTTPIRKRKYVRKKQLETNV